VSLPQVFVQIALVTVQKRYPETTLFEV